ncbi:MAG TPA: glycine--tRNA ligase [Patescibacteria group bacterium]|jgi:glycyl-tRNA synthetase
MTAKKKTSAPAVTMEKVANLAKRRGFLFGGSDIYGGLQGTYDYGHYGALLKQRIKDAWLKANVQQMDNMVALDASILMHPKVWEASGHTANFSDALVDDRISKKRYRADHLIEEQLGMKVEGLSNEDLTKIFEENEIKTPEGKQADWTDVRSFNLMFKTHAGPIADDDAAIYLRPETAQGIFVDYKEVQATTRKKLPFGIAQIGKAFRNEITPGKFIFRLREFEQMEIEFFCKPDESKQWHEWWQKERMRWYVDVLGIDKKKLKLRPHTKDELSHYSAGTSDIDYEFPFGFSELEGIANRTDFDLKQHQEVSGKDLQYFDDASGKSFLPHVIEPSCGADRIVFAVLCDAYTEEPDEKGDVRTVLKLKPSIAPISAAILPLMKKPELTKLAGKVRDDLATDFMLDYDVTGSIGKRYRRQDEIGTPLCCTVDFDSLEDQAVTVRERDSQKQERVKIVELKDYLADKLS